MPETRLRETLEALHEELAHAEPVDEEARALLGEVLEDIHALLDGPDPDAHEGLLERLQTATRRFEESHPSITDAVGRVASALANLGI